MGTTEGRHSWFHVAGRLRPFTGVAVAAVGAYLAACGSGGGGSSGRGEGPAPAALTLSALSAPATIYAGQTVALTFRILTPLPRRRVPVNLELVPLGAGGIEAAILSPAHAGYRALEAGGLTVEDLGGGEEREVTVSVFVDDELPAGAYAAVLRADKYDWFGTDGREPARPHRSPRAPFVASVVPVEVVAPDLPDIRVLSVVLESPAFRAAESGGIGPEVDGAPETGDTEIEGDLSAAVLLAAYSRPVAGSLHVRFDLGVPDAGGASTAWYPLEVIDRTAGGAGTVLTAEALLAPPPDSPNALEEAGRRGFSAHLVLPQAARDDLMSREEDTVCVLRTTADPADEHPEWQEGLLGENNVLDVPVVHLGPAGSGDPVEAVGAPPLQALEPRTRPGETVQYVLSGDRLDGDNVYPLRAFGWESGNDYGDPSTLAIGYRVGASLTYSPSTFAAIPTGRKVAFRIPRRSDLFLRAEGGGGSASGYAQAVGSWERFTMEIQSRTGSLYDVRLVASDGSHTLAVGATMYKGSAYLQVNFKLTAAAPTSVFRLTDTNGGELASGDPVTLESGGVPVVALSQGLGSALGAPATPMTLLDADPASVPRKAKFITDNHVDFDIFNRSRSLLKVAAAAEFDSEDVARTYFDWEVRVVGVKVWGDYAGVEMAGDEARAATLWDSTARASTALKAAPRDEGDPEPMPCPRPEHPNPPPPAQPRPPGPPPRTVPTCSLPATATNAPSKYTKHKEAEAKSNVWVGPVPVAVTTGGQGSLGVRGAVWIGANNRIVAEAGPFVSFTAFASAGIDVGFASASLRGELTLLKVSLLFRGTIQIAVGDTTAKITLTAPLTLTTMSGRLYVRVTWNLVLVRGSEDWDIVSWSGWVKTFDLFPPKSWEW